MKQARNAGQSQRFRLLVLALGCFLVYMTFVVLSRPGMSSSGSPADHNSGEDDGRNHDIVMHETSSSSFSSGRSDRENSELRDVAENSDEQEEIEEEKNRSENKIEPESKTESESKTEPETSLESERKIESESTDKSEAEESSSKIDAQPQEVTFPTASNYNISDAEQPENTAGENADERRQIANADRKPLCDTSEFRADVCDMNGDIRIPGNTSSVLFVEQGSSNESYIIHPYPRKGDDFCFAQVHQVTVKSSNVPPQCTKNYTIPSVVFSNGGYAGNLFHDFTDLLIPLFLTAGEFDGEVLLIATDFAPFWIYKYMKFFQKLSHYPVIDFEKDREVHCFNRAIVGLRAHHELTIDPTRSPKGLSMVDFTKFVRSAFSLPREATTNVEDLSSKKPRLMLIARKRTRTFTNVDEIVQMAEGLGFEVVVHDAEAGIHIAEFAEVVNSCDVLMGVHGAGLTNAMFLPPNATLIQIVPRGSLEGIAMLDFGNPAKAMELNYVQYSISVDESSLLEKYPRDHPVFTDPLQYHGQGFDKLRTTFLDQQNVKLNVTRFRTVLWKVLEHIIQ